MSFLEWIRQPWPWYVAGPLIGLMVPALLIMGNRTLGISSSLRHACAACVPFDIHFFKYDWKKEIWNLLFVAGIIVGGFITFTFLANPDPIVVNPKLAEEMSGYGITNYTGIIPSEVFNWPALLTAKRLDHDCIWRVPRGFWYKLCRRMYIWSCHYGLVKSSMAFPCCHLLFYGRRFYHGQSHSTIYFKTLIKFIYG